MPWLRIDDGFIENTKIEGLRDRTFRVHVAGLCYSARNLTDGYISPKGAKVISVLLGFQVTRYITELVTAELWEPEVRGGHWINDYLEYNPSADEVKTTRERNAERQRKHRQAKAAIEDSLSQAESHVTSLVSHSVSHAAPSQPNPSQVTSTPLSRLPELLALFDAEGREKIKRAVTANRCSEGCIGLALEAARHRSARDPLAVALSTLKKRRAA